MDSSYSEIAREGLWHNNIGLVQLLGLCPLLAVTNTFINGLGLGLATLLILVSSNVLVSSFRHWIPQEIRLPIFVLIIACAVTAIELLMQAYYFQLYGILGIFIPLIVTNCALVGRAEAFAIKNTPLKAALDGFAMGLGFLFVLMLLGAVREILGQGTLFSHAHLMFGESAHWTIHFFEQYRGFLLAALPPGAFIGLGLLIAAKNAWAQRQAANTVQTIEFTNQVKA